MSFGQFAASVGCDHDAKLTPDGTGLRRESTASIFPVARGVVGRPGSFSTAVAVLDRLKAGTSPNEIRRALAADDGTEEIDVDDLIATLQQIGFVRMSGISSAHDEQASKPATIGFSINPWIVGLFFSRSAIAIYVALAIGAMACVSVSRQFGCTPMPSL